MLGGFHVLDMAVAIFLFVLLVYLVGKFAWGPVMNMMQKREDYVASEINAAEQSRAAAEKAQKESEEKLTQTKQDAQQIIDDARNAGTKLEEDIVASAKQEAERIKESAKEEIQNEKDKALQALQEQVSSLSVLIASKVIEKEISAQDQEELIADYIKQVGEEQ